MVFSPVHCCRLGLTAINDETADTEEGRVRSPGARATCSTGESGQVAVVAVRFGGCKYLCWNSINLGVGSGCFEGGNDLKLEMKTSGARQRCRKYSCSEVIRIFDVLS